MKKIHLFILIAFSIQRSFAQFCEVGSFTLNNPSASDVGRTSVSLSWTAASNAANYTVEYRESGESNYTEATTTSNRSYTITGLSSGEEYDFRITAKRTCIDGEGFPLPGFAFSNVRTETMEPAIPSTNSASGVGTTSFTARWFSRTGATDYYLDVSTSSLFTSFVTGYNNLDVNNSTSRSVTGLSSGTRYYYRVRAGNYNGTSNSSSARTVYTVPTSPDPSADNNTQNSFRVNWGDVTGAESYRLDVSTNSSFTSFITGYNNADVGSGNSHTLNGLDAGTIYYFRMRAYDSDGNQTSSSSSTKNTETIPDTPIANTAVGITSTSFTADWDQVSGADNYLLDISDFDNFSSFFDGYDGKEVTPHSEAVAGMTPGSIVYYRVRSENSGGESPNSGTVEVILAIDAPILESPSDVTSQGFTLDWNDIVGADHYELDISTSNDFSSFVTGYNGLHVNASAFTADNLNPGVNYFMRVRTISSENVKSADSNVEEALTLAGIPLAASATSISQTGFTANWSEVTEADNYRLDVSDDDFATFLDGYNGKLISTTSESISGLIAGASYSYRVRSENTTGESANSQIETVLLLPETPTMHATSEIKQTEFMVTWDAIDGSDFLLDVSTEEDFSSFVDGYDSREAFLVGELVRGLDPGTTYFCRVRSLNSTGPSGYSETVSALTIPADPTTNSGMSIGTTAFTASWEAVSGSDIYLLDISEDNFVSFLTGYEAREVTGVSVVVEELQSATSYSYRVRSKNATGESNSSTVIDVLTLPKNPILNTADNITQTSFAVSWEAVNGEVDNYLLDISESVNFTSFLSGYEGKVVNEISETIDQLSSGIQYFYRVRATNGTGESENSEVQSALTISGTPSIVGFSDKSATQVKVIWEKVIGAESYEIMVSENSDFTTLVSGNDPKIVSSSLSEDFIQGLDPETVYYVRIRSRNVTGASTFSEVRTTTTTDSNGNALDPKIEVANADVASINFNVTGGFRGISSVKLFHKKRTEDEYIEVALDVKEDGIYFLNIQPEWLDDFGMDYKIEAIDGLGVVVEFSNKVLRQIDRVEISSVLSFGSDVEDYTIISVPYEMGNTIEDLFERLLGEHDDSKWRIVQYRNGGNFDYTEGLSKEQIIRGQGYWFVSASEIALNLGSAIAPENTPADLFKMELAAGWNQIGNPYPFDLKWRDVLNHNDEILGLSPLFVFDASNRSFVESDDLQVFSGGFVYSEDAVTIEIPISPASDFGRGRTYSNHEKSKGWEVHFKAHSGDVSNSLSSIGMKANASAGNGQFLQVVLPRFVQYVELKSDRVDKNGLHLIEDIVEASDSHQWDFKIESNTGSSVLLEWDFKEIPMDKGLYMHDIQKGTILNMRDVNSVEFESNSNLKIYAIDEINEINGLRKFGDVYPNPVETNLTIPIDFGINEESNTLLQVFNLDGTMVFQRNYELINVGLRNIDWDSKLENGESLNQGIYLYKVYSNGQLQNTGRVIKK